MKTKKRGSGPSLRDRNIRNIDTHFFKSNCAAECGCRVNAKDNPLEAITRRSQVDTAKILGVTRQAVGQIERQALAKVRSGMRRHWNAYKAGLLTPETNSIL